MATPFALALGILQFPGLAERLGSQHRPLTRLLMASVNRPRRGCAVTGWLAFRPLSCSASSSLAALDVRCNIGAA
jgi:hypothetical protein